MFDAVIARARALVEGAPLGPATLSPAPPPTD
jgi:hypothetical protein